MGAGTSVYAATVRMKKEAAGKPNNEKKVLKKKENG